MNSPRSPPLSLPFDSLLDDGYSPSFFFRFGTSQAAKAEHLRHSQETQTVIGPLTSVAMHPCWDPCGVSGWD